MHMYKVALSSCSPCHQGGASLVTASHFHSDAVDFNMWSSVTQHATPIALEDPHASSAEQTQALKGQRGMGRVSICTMSSCSRIMVVADEVGVLRAYNATTSGRIHLIGESVHVKVPGKLGWYPALVLSYNRCQ